MTTIAYRDGVMASDSRCSDDFSDRHLTKCKKIFRLQSGALLGICGDDDVRDLIKLLDNVKTEDDLPNRQELAQLRHDGAYLLALPNKELWHISTYVRTFYHTEEWSGSLRQIREKFAAVGSGSDLAIGALEHGATAEEAIKCAIKWDLYSAGPVVSEEL